MILTINARIQLIQSVLLFIGKFSAQGRLGKSLLLAQFSYYRRLSLFPMMNIILVNTLAESTSEKNSIIAEHTDGGKHVDSCSETKNNSSSELEDSATMIVNGGSDPSIELPKSTSTKSALELNYKVSEDDNAEKLSSEISSDDQPETNSKLLDNFVAIMEAGEENELQLGIDQVIDDADGGPHFICTSSLPDNGVNQGSRTPFAVKNLVSDVVKESNSLTVLTSDAFVKIDAMPSYENIVSFEGKNC